MSEQRISIHPNSPNGCWQRHGYSIERMAYVPDGKLTRRIIRNPQGEIVLDGCSYDDEITYCKEHGLMISDGGQRETKLTRGVTWLQQRHEQTQ